MDLRELLGMLDMPPGESYYRSRIPCPEDERVARVVLDRTRAANALSSLGLEAGDRVAIASYLGGGDAFDRAILDFSKAYADQNERDYNTLAAAVKSGRIVAQTGV